MDERERDQFVKEAVKSAYRMELFEAVGGGRAAMSDTAEHAQQTKELEQAKVEAEKLVRHPSVLERLCPALKSVSSDLGTVATTAASVLLPMSVGPQAVFTITPLVVGAVAVIAVRAGVSGLCP